MSFLIDTSRFIVSGGSSYITNVQYGSVTIGSGVNNATATISSVDTSKSFLVYLGFTTDGAAGVSVQIDMARLTLTNSTTVTANINNSSTRSVTVNFAVVEATSNLVASVQFGTVSIAASTSGTATISSVDTSRSAVFWLGHSSTSATSNTRAYNTGVSLTSATQVTAYADLSATYTVSFVVVQFASAAIQSVQQVSDAYTTSNVTDTKTITSVTQSNAMIAFGGATNNASNYRDGRYSLELTSGTNVNLTRGTGTTSALTRAAYYTIVEFKSGVLKTNAQRGAIDLTSATSNTATITSVTTSKTILNYTGFRTTNNNTLQNCNIIFPKITLTNGTTVTATRNTSDSFGNNTGYEIIEFN